MITKEESLLERITRLSNTTREEFDLMTPEKRKAERQFILEMKHVFIDNNKITIK